MNILILSAYTFYHAVLILVPVIFIGIYTINYGIRSPVLVLAIGAAGAGLLSYCIFWVSLASSLVGMILVFCLYILIIYFGIKKLPPLWNSELIKAYFPPVLLWYSYALFILAAGLAPSGLLEPLSMVAVRFSHGLPIDNQLPLIFAKQILSGTVSVPMVGDWLSSDRPPLQSAYFLLSGASVFSNIDLHYQVQSTLLQSLWIIALWVLLISRGVDKLLLAITLVVTMFSGVAFVHVLFTWPKLFPAFYIILAYSILFHPDTKIQQHWGFGVITGILATLAILCHGSSVFALAGIGIALLLTRRIPGILFITSTIVSCLLVYATWSIYQGVIDPPGDRLLKWHLAGVMSIDPRSFGETIVQSYQALSLQEIVNYKLANFLTLFGEPLDYTVRYMKAVFITADMQELINLRDNQFFTVWSAWGILSTTVSILLFAPFYGKSLEKDLGQEFLLVTSLIMLVWVLLLFGPSTAIIHQGSLFMMLWLFAGSIIYCYSFNRHLAIVMATLHMYATYKIYLSYGWSPVNLTSDSSLKYLAFICFAICIAILGVTAKNDFKSKLTRLTNN